MITAFQERCMEVVHKGRNGQASITDIAYRLKTSRLAVYSAMQSLERQKKVGYFRSSPDQWGVIIYFLRREAAGAPT